ncbi:MAG TPA: DNA-binding response regulator [Microscillaceae bacterium]|nr:DNA-binding response regulator [Microscillaceae bacterium]
MPIKCLIVDDEPLAIKILEQYIADLDNLELVASCRSATKALTYLEKETIDVIFLDIQMPQITGMAMAKSLQSPPKIVFTTAYRDFAVESYEVNAIDYLVKPISFERFFQAIQKLKTSSTPSPSNESNLSISPETLLIKADKKQFVIKLIDIQYIESIKDYVIVHTPHQDLVSYQTMQQVIDALPITDFLRIHRSFIINLNHLKAFNHSNVFVAENEIPIGRTYKEEVYQKLNQRFS